MLKLKLQYFGHLMWRPNSLEKTLMLGKMKAGGEGADRIRWLEGTTDSMDMRLTQLRETVKDRETWSVAVHVVKKSQTRLTNWRTMSGRIIPDIWGKRWRFPGTQPPPAFCLWWPALELSGCALPTCLLFQNHWWASTMWAVISNAAVNLLCRKGWKGCGSVTVLALTSCHAPHFRCDICFSSLRSTHFKQRHSLSLQNEYPTLEPIFPKALFISYELCYVMTG